MIPIRWIRSTLLPNWKILLVLLLPLFLLPLPILVNTREARAGYVIIIVSLFLISSALPLAVTSLLPIALLPLLNVLGTNDVCSAYFKGPNVVCFCSVALALGVEQSALHRRVALRALLLVGVDPKWLMLAFMFLSMFMSMWIANSAVTAMLLPIMRSLVNEIFEEENPSSDESAIAVPTNNNDNYSSRMEFAVECQPPDEKLRSDYKRKVQTAMYLSVAYSCAIGGTTTLVGSGALLLKGIIDGLYPNGNSLNFPSYMALAVPIALVNGFLTWLWLCFLYIGFRKRNGNSQFIRDPDLVRSSLRRQYEALGPMTFHQGGITFLFGLLILLWFFKSPQFMPGWITLIGSRFEIGDATPGIAVVFLAFIIPAKPKWPACLKWRESGGAGEITESTSSTSLLDWNYTQKNFPWNVILLYGSGYALSEASSASGLSNWLGQHLSGLHSLPPIAIMILACLITTSITEIANNSATAAICLPVLIKLAETTGMNPLYLMIPATIHCNYAFMLPAGTPPNSMVLEAGKIEPSHLLRAGIVVNIYCMFVCCVMTITLGDLIFNWSTIPDWMVPLNSTNNYTS